MLFKVVEMGKMFQLAHHYSHFLQAESLFLLVFALQEARRSSSTLVEKPIYTLKESLEMFNATKLGGGGGDCWGLEFTVGRSKSALCGRHLRRPTQRQDHWEPRSRGPLRCYYDQCCSLNHDLL